MLSNGNFCADRWFSGIKRVEEASEKGVDYCWTLRKFTRHFPWILRKNQQKSGQ